jgi:hypothetical protein
MTDRRGFLGALAAAVAAWVLPVGRSVSSFRVGSPICALSFLDETATVLMVSGQKIKLNRDGEYDFKDPGGGRVQLRRIEGNWFLTSIEYPRRGSAVRHHESRYGTASSYLTSSTIKA